MFSYRPLYDTLHYLSYTILDGTNLNSKHQMGTRTLNWTPDTSRGTPLVASTPVFIWLREAASTHSRALSARIFRIFGERPRRALVLAAFVWPAPSKWRAPLSGD